QMLRHYGKAGHYEVHEPPNTHADGAANAVQGGLLVEQALHQDALFLHDHPVSSGHDELAARRPAVVILLAVVDMAVFLESLRSTLQTRVFQAPTHGQV